MPEINLTSTDGLIESNIKPRRDTYYLVTEEHLKNLNGKNILTDIFFMIASVLWGAYFSVTITKSASSIIDETTLRLMNVYQSVFLYSGLVFTVLALIFLFFTYTDISKIKKSNLPSD